MGSEGVPRGVHESSADMLRDIYVRKVQDRLESFQQKIIEDVKMKMEAIIDDVVKDLKTYEVTTENKALLSEEPESVSGPAMKKKPADAERSSKLPDKIFIPRNSLLTDLFEVKHIKSIYNIFIVMLSLLFMNTLLHDFVVEGRINLGFRTIKLGFANFDRALIIWCVMQLAVFALYYAFRAWAAFRFSVRKMESKCAALDYGCVISFTGFLILFAFGAAWATVKYELGLVTSLALQLDMTRQLMKMYAFVRSNAPRQLKLDVEIKEDEYFNVNRQIPQFHRYCYFVFAPTAIYRDNYPRTARIDWKFARSNLLQFFGSIWFIAMIYERTVEPNLQQFLTMEISIANLIVFVFSQMFPGTLIFWLVFYCYLHCFLNFTSEILQFADRHFYADWWTSTNYSSFFRKWNMVVQDFLYEYIYKDFSLYVFKNKVISSIAVMIISEIFHEHAITMALRFFYPVLFIFFTLCGIPVMFLTRNITSNWGNYLQLFTLSLGEGILTAAFGIELTLRNVCPVDPYSFLPVFMTCLKVNN